MVCPEVRELYLLRRRYGISRSLVCNILKISETNLYRYEKKDVLPIIAHRRKLQQFLKVFKEIEAKSEEENV